MKMKLLFTIAFVLSLAVELVAQKKVAIEFGPLQKFKFKESFLSMDILSADAGGYYALQVPYTVLYGNVLGGIKNYHLAKYGSTDLTKASSFSMDAVEEENNKTYLKTVALKEEIYIFSSREDDKQETNSLYVQTVDKKAFAPKTDCKKIAEIDFSKDSKYKKSKFVVDFSSDSSKILVTYCLLNKDEEMIRNGFFVMDRKFNTLWKFENPSNMENGVFSYISYDIDNKGDVFLLLKVFDNVKEFEDSNKLKKKSFISNTRRVRREANYSYKVLTFSAGKQTNSYTLSQKGKFITDTELGLSSKGDVIVTGLFAEEGKTSVKGAFSMKINKNARDISDKDFVSFEESFLTEGMDEKTLTNYKQAVKEGEEYDENDYLLQEIIFHENGTYSLIAEQNIVEEKTVRTANMISSEYHYQDKDIWMMNFKGDGSLNWKQKITKYQKTVNIYRFYASFAHHVGKDKTYFIFNDIPKGAHKKSVACVVAIDKDGKSTKQELFSSAENKIVLQPLSFKQINPYSMVIMGQKKYDHLLVKLKF